MTDPVVMPITVDEVAMLFRAALDDDDYVRADRWASLLLHLNDDPEPAR
jgi:hypothetical protein